jgi:hypothetical protein
MQVGLGSKSSLGRSVAMHWASTKEPRQAEANRQSTAPPAKHLLACLETASRWQVDHAIRCIESRSGLETFRGEGCIIRSLSKSSQGFPYVCVTYAGCGDHRNSPAGKFHCWREGDSCGKVGINLEGELCAD